GKLAAGINHETINIQGGQMFVLPTGTVAAFNGGLLALPSNIGIHQRSSFAVVPEVNLNLGYQLTESLKLFVGYDFLWWSNVVRPGDQIDTTLNINQIPNFVKSPNPGPNRPLVPFKTSDFWAQGMNVGLEYR